MNTISAALAGGVLRSTGADRAGDESGESEAVSKPFPAIGCNYCGEKLPDGEPHLCVDPLDPSNVGDTCCGKCPGDSCYVDYITGERE